MASISVIVPESPVVEVQPLSAADVKEAQTSPLLTPNHAGLSRITPPFPFTSDPTPASVLQALEDADDDAPLSATGDEERDEKQALILRHALEWAVHTADVELVGFLAGLDGAYARMLDTEVATIEDEEGWGVVGQAIQSSCGLSDKEEAVRLIVGRWGVSAGPRGGRDRAGWTPLHLAALLSSPQIVSVLLNRGASATALTATGLSAYDLIAGTEGREPLAVLLDPLHYDGHPNADESYTPPPISSRRKELIMRRRYRIATRGQREEHRATQVRTRAERERWVRERAKNIGVNASVLFPEHREVEGDGDDDDDEATDADDDDDDHDAQMKDAADVNNALVFSLNQLAFLFDILITKYPPLCQPRERRSLPANAIFLYARFAHYQCDETWLEELLDGAIERIERGVYSNGDDLAYLAFWEYNLTLLLALIKTDDSLHTACTEMNLLGMVVELINAIHVFVIRIAERKIDEILDAAMLDFESLDDFEEVRFADQWNLFRSFASRKKRETPLAAAMFSVPNSPAKSTHSFDSPQKQAAAPPSPSPSGHSHSRSISDLKAEAREVLASGLEKAQAVLASAEKPSPRRVTDVLTNVLMILQLYDVNPAFIVQVFSQTFYWISSELFNRIITRKKYLCRTKAVQIRMNITALEDWTRQNGLPPNIASKHLEPVMQLLQWLQCLSQINQFDMLIGTVQNLRALNPLQMRRAVRDYRFEVNEGRMADDCVQYLAQMQKDWERRRVHIGLKTAASQAGVADDDSMPIEALFDGSVGIGEWLPQSAPECLGELVDSRFMLPFLVPTSVEFLMATPPPDAAFRNLLTDGPLLPDGSIPSRPLSRASYSSSKPMGWALPSQRRIRQLPDDFFTWLKERQAEFVRAWGGPMRKEKEKDKEGKENKKSMEITPTRPAPPPPLPDKTGVSGLPMTPSMASSTSVSGLPEPLYPLPEYHSTPAKALPAVPDKLRSTPALSHARKASTDLALRRAREDMTPPGSEPIELVTRTPSGDVAASPSPVVNGGHAPDLVSRSRPNGNVAMSPSPAAHAASGSPSHHYELSRLRRERKASVSSVNSVSSSGGSSDKKRWWKLSRKSSTHGQGSPHADATASPTASPDDIRADRRRERENTAETIMPARASASPTPTPPHAAKRSSTADTIRPSPGGRHSPAPISISPERGPLGTTAVQQSIFETDEEMGRRR